MELFETISAKCNQNKYYSVTQDSRACDVIIIKWQGTKVKNKAGPWKSAPHDHQAPPKRCYSITDPSSLRRAFDKSFCFGM